MADARIIPISGEAPASTTSAPGANPSQPAASASSKSNAGRVKGGAAARPRARTRSKTESAEQPEPQQTPLPGADYEKPSWDDKVAGALSFLRRRVTGDYPVDDFGFDAELLDQVLIL